MRHDDFLQRKRFVNDKKCANKHMHHHLIASVLIEQCLYSGSNRDFAATSLHSFVSSSGGRHQGDETMCNMLQFCF